MKKWLPFLFFFVLGLLQATVLDVFKFFHAKPDLLLTVIVAACFYFDFRTAIFLSLWAGFLKDAFSLPALGMNVILCPFFSWLIFRLTRKMVIELSYLYAVLVFLVVFCHGILSGILLSFFEVNINWLVVLRSVFLSSLYSAAASPLLFAASKKLSAYPKR